MSILPPTTTQSWARLSPHERRIWLESARDRHFKLLQERGGWQDAPPGSTFVVKGEGVNDFLAFFCALGEAINGGGGYFGSNLTSLQDCLFGGFGATLPFTVHIEHADHVAHALGSDALVEWACQRIDAGDFLDEDGKQYLEGLKAAGKDQQRTLLQEIISVLQFHGVTVELD